MSRAEYQREWRKRNPGKSALYSKRYKDKNYEFVLQANRNWKQENKEAVKEYNAKWSKANLDKLRVHKHNRRAKVKQVGGTHTFQDILHLFEKQNHLCNVCEAYLFKYDIDHIIPISRGGSNSPDNLQLLCQHCNAVKHNKTMDEFMTYLTKKSNSKKENKSRNG